MVVRIYVWKKPGGSVFNYFAYTVGISKILNKFLDFQTSVGHAAIEIETKNYLKKYISHRPKPPVNNKKIEFVTDLFNQECLFDDITYEDECNKRKEAAYFSITLEGLDETAILNTYEKECNSGRFSYYHGLKNNCCKIVYILLKLGLRCPDGEKCEFCDCVKYGLPFEENPLRNSIKFLDNNKITLIFTFKTFVQNNLYRFALLLLQDYRSLNALSNSSDGNLSNLVKLVNRKVIESWTPDQVINLVKEIETYKIRSCQKHEVIKKCN